MTWPEWWSWELEFSPHLMKRMSDRGFNEADIRSMLEDAVRLRADVQIGRWIVETTHDRWPWEVIVEPDYGSRALVVITAYPVFS